MAFALASSRVLCRQRALAVAVQGLVAPAYIYIYMYIYIYIYNVCAARQGVIAEALRCSPLRLRLRGDDESGGLVVTFLPVSRLPQKILL